MRRIEIKAAMGMRREADPGGLGKPAERKARMVEDGGMGRSEEGGYGGGGIERWAVKELQSKGSLFWAPPLK